MEQELLELRKKIIEGARELAMSGDIAAETRLNVLLELSKDGGDPAAALNQAYDAAQIVGSDDDKLNAFLDILYEIDTHLAPTSTISEQPQGGNSMGLPSELSHLPEDKNEPEQQ